MHLPKILRLALILLVATGIFSCVKDVDFDQAGDISLQPEVQADLLIFEIDQRDFIDPDTNRQRLTISDTVRLEFLDDDYVQKDLEKVEFSFKYRNTFPQTFSNRILFLSENNQLQHEVIFETVPGTAGRPEISEKHDTIEPPRIHVIKRSIKMVVEITAISNSAPFTGTLNFESKGLFYFQF